MKQPTPSFLSGKGRRNPFAKEETVRSNSLLERIVGVTLTISVPALPLLQPASALASARVGAEEPEDAFIQILDEAGGQSKLTNHAQSFLGEAGLIEAGGPEGTMLRYAAVVAEQVQETEVPGEGGMEAEEVSRPTECPPCPPDPTRTPEMEATALYQLGLYWMAKGEWNRARDLFQRVVSEYPESPVAASAGQRLDELATDKPPASEQAAGDSHSGESRAGFIVFETTVGAYVGGTLPALMEMGPKGVLTGAMLGTMGGLGLSLLASGQPDWSAAKGAMITFGQLYGAGNLVMWNLVLPDYAALESFPGLSVAGLGLGTIAGIIMGNTWPHVPAGNVDLIGSAGLWSTYFVETLLLLAGTSTDNVYTVAAPLSADLGAVAAALAVHQSGITVSRSRVRLLNLGGVVGAFLTSGIATLMEFDPHATGVLMLTGAALGIGTAYRATMNWDERTHADLISRKPSPHLLTLEDGKIRLGQPIPVLAFHPTSGATRTAQAFKSDASVHLNLFGGEF